MSLALVERASRFDVAIGGAGVDLLPAALVPEFTAAYRFTILVNAAVVFNVRTTSGGSTVVGALNNGTALTANAYATFVFGVVAGRSYQFRLSGAAQLLDLVVHEVRGATL